MIHAAPQRAPARRNLVLQQFRDTGLDRRGRPAGVPAQPLGIAETPGLPRDRYPAFLDLVRAQLAARLRSMPPCAAPA